MTSENVGLICPLRNGFACAEERCAWWTSTRCAILSLAMAVEVGAVVAEAEHERLVSQDFWTREGD